MADSAARGNRIAAAGWGAAFRAEFGYLAAPWLVAPHVTAGAAWGRDYAPAWERNGYEEPAWYMGLLSQEAVAGALYRYPVAEPQLYVYAGPAFLAVRERHEVQNTYGEILEKTNGTGYGWAVIAGAEFRPGAGEAVGFQILYGQAYSRWSGLPAAAADEFTLVQLQLGGFFRFYL
jgi:hypothetical protein